MKLLNAILSEKGLSISSFEDAFSHAISLYKDIGYIEQSERIRVGAAISYSKYGAICDLGSYVNCKCISSGACAVGYAGDNSILLSPSIT
jgi:hypothetical protein